VDTAIDHVLNQTCNRSLVHAAIASKGGDQRRHHARQLLDLEHLDKG
jgi:hypothetical protein